MPPELEGVDEPVEPPWLVGMEDPGEPPVVEPLDDDDGDEGMLVGIEVEPVVAQPPTVAAAASSSRILGP